MGENVIITGIRGQDGVLLASLLLRKGYDVWGVDRRSGESSYWRLREEGIFNKVRIVHADLTDFYAIRDAIRTIQPSMIFNLAAQSFVAASFANPYSTINTNQIGLLNILEAVKDINRSIRVYQASTSELFGVPMEVPQRETTPFYPRSPYGIAKLGAHWLAVNYRESYDMFCCCGILFNHESEYRGEEFVTRKITSGVARIVSGTQRSPIVLGNLDAKRDWGYARDYVEAMYRMMVADDPDDYVVATGRTHTIREFATMAFAAAGIEVSWEREGKVERAISPTHGVVVETSDEFKRPAEVSLLCGDASKIRDKLGWTPSCSLEAMITLMVDADMRRIQHAKI